MVIECHLLECIEMDRCAHNKRRAKIAKEVHETMKHTKNDDPAVCHGKVGFQSPTLALRAAGRGRKSRAVYRCGACGLYHVGTRSREDRLEGRRPREL